MLNKKKSIKTDPQIPFFPSGFLIMDPFTVGIMKYPFKANEFNSQQDTLICSCGRFPDNQFKDFIKNFHFNFEEMTDRERTKPLEIISSLYSSKGSFSV